MSWWFYSLYMATTTCMAKSSKSKLTSEKLTGEKKLIAKSLDFKGKTWFALNVKVNSLAIFNTLEKYSLRNAKKDIFKN